MEEKNQPQAQPAEIEAQLTALAPQNIIRTETVLSKLPIHNLAKRGGIDINILQQNEQGLTTLKWTVTPNPTFGIPRQLAYKLDTIIINRKIDEISRPLPKIIRLGSLREIEELLGLGVGGGSKTGIRNALLQNAFAGITAKLTYQGNDGVEHSLEAAFTRYSLYFTGEKLPGGRKADAVYISLNDPYWEILNNAPVRPLDYDYLRELAPAPQRFYEIISRKMFAALRYQHAEAKISYSEYCTYSAQQRYFDYDPFKKQMYKVHRPHVQSRYLKAVRYGEIRDAKGAVDWMMYYEPGLKARAEYNAFTRSGRSMEPNAEIESVEMPRIGVAKPRQPARQRSLNFPKTPIEIEVVATVADMSSVEHPAVGKMIERGIGEPTAKKLFAEAQDPDFLLDQLEWGDHMIRQAKEPIRNPAGFYITLITAKTPPSASFETSRQKAKREEEEKNRLVAQLRHAETEVAYEDYLREALNDHIVQNHLETEVEAIAQMELKKEKQKFPMMSADIALKRAREKARWVIKNRLLPSLLTFEEFAAKRTTTLEG